MRRRRDADMMFTNSDLLLKLGDELRHVIDRFLPLTDLRPQGPQFAAARNEPRRGLALPDHQRAIESKEIAGEGDEVQAFVSLVSEREGVSQILNNPSFAKQASNQRREFGRALDETISPTDNAQLFAQL